jgi:hypothetical protein
MSEEKIWWKKLGGGSLRNVAGIKLIKPGERFKAKASDIPENFRDVVIPQQNIPEEPVVITQGVKPTYILQPAKRNGWFDIVDSQGKIFSDKAMPKDKAQSLIADLLRER